MTDAFEETESFRRADRRIVALKDRLSARGLCDCCVDRALLFHGAALLEESIGSDEAAALCQQIASALRKNRRSAPDLDVPPSRH
jgi:hypothetical protein